MSDADWDPWDWHQPIRSDRGIRARGGGKGRAGSEAWSTRWLAALAALAPQQSGRISRGRGYARQGQVLELAQGKGGIEALVQGSRPRPYRVRIGLPAFAPRLRETLAEVVGREAGHQASLLAGALSMELAAACAEAGAPLLPEQPGDLEQSCDCPDPTRPCKHLVAVHVLLAERLDDDPLLLLRLRGVDPAALLRTAQAAAPAAPDQPLPEDDSALDEDLARFWELDRLLAQAAPAAPQPPPVPLPVLRRLGQPDFLATDLARRIGPAVQGAAQAARRLAAGELPD